MSEEKTEIQSVDAENTEEKQAADTADVTQEEMAEKEGSEEITEDSEEITENTEDEADGEDVKAVSDAPRKGRTKGRPLFRAPILIAACIFLCTILFFAGWKLFFDTSIEGDWAVEVTSDSGEKIFGYTFSFEGDHVFRMRSGGTSLVGRYYSDTRKKSDGTSEPIISIYLTNMGSSYISADFGYTVSGNAFSGRVLRLTDYTGIFMPSDNAESDPEDVKNKKKITGFVEEDGTTYYSWDFLSSDYKPQIDYFDDFKKDESVSGSWKYTDTSTDYSYTLTFNDDGSFEQYSYESELVGAYRYSDGKFSLRFYSLGGKLSETEIAASVSGDKLTFNGLSYTRTADKNDYKTGIK